MKNSQNPTSNNFFRIKWNCRFLIFHELLKAFLGIFWWKPQNREWILWNFNWTKNTWIIYGKTRGGKYFEFKIWNFRKNFNRKNGIKIHHYELRLMRKWCNRRVSKKHHQTWKIKNCSNIMISIFNFQPFFNWIFPADLFVLHQNSLSGCGDVDWKGFIN